jgi:hypothetical protein
MRYWPRRPNPRTTSRREPRTRRPGKADFHLRLEQAYYYEAPLRAEVRASNGKCWSATFDELRYPGAKLKGAGGQ